jgi:hypothetical protein
MKGLFFIKMLFIKCMGFFSNITKMIFGGLSWQPPFWLQKLFSIIKDKFYKDKKKFIISSFSVLAFLCLSIYGLNWYLNLPKPDYVKFTIYAPEPKNLNEDNPSINPLVVKFDRSVRAISKDKILENDIIIKPSIQGAWAWTSDNNLVFTPQSDWDIKTKYKIKFNPSIFSNNVKFESYQLDFTTKPLESKIISFELYINPQDRREKRLSAIVEFSHEISLESLNKNISLMNANGRDLKFTTKLNSKGNIVYINSENITILPEEMKYKIVVERGVKALNYAASTQNGNDKYLTVPSVYNYFKVDDISINIVNNERLEAEQILSIKFTDMVKETELKKNLRALLLPKKETGLFFQADSDTLKNSTPLEMSLIPNEADSSDLFNFKIKSEPGRQVFIEFKKGFKSDSGFELPISFNKLLDIPDFPVVAKIQQRGGLLSMLGDKKLSISSRGVEEIEVRVNRLKDSELNHLLTQSDGHFTDPHFENYYIFNYLNISEVFSEKIKLKKDKLDGIQYSSVDLEPYFTKGSKQGHGVYYLELVVNDDVTDKRFLVVSDLSVIYKKFNQNNGTVYVYSLKTGNPIDGAKIEIIGKNGLPIFKESTDSDGKAEIISLKDFDLEKSPQYLLVRHNGDLSFLPLKKHDRKIDYSRFDVGGFEESSPSELNAFIFSQRGLFRPGEWVRLGYIVRSGDWKTKLANIPIEIEVLNSKGTRFLSRKDSLTDDGYGELNFETSTDSPTGVYTVIIKQIGVDKNKQKTITQIGQSTFKVEEFEPDSLTISSVLNKKSSQGWNNLDGNEVIVTLRNLFGTPAVGNKVKAKLSITNSFPQIKEYKQYKFYNPNQEFKTITEDLGEVETDSNGNANFKIFQENLHDGLHQLILKGEGFAKNSGRSVLTAYSMIVSNRPFILGYKSDQLNLDFIKENANASIDMIALNKELKLGDTVNLKLNLVEIKNISTLMKGEDDLYKYQVIEKKNVISEKELTFKKGVYSYELPTNKVGRFELIFENNKMVFLKIPFNVIGKSDELQKLSRSSELELKLNKDSYDNGDIMELQITAPYAGNGLITIERDKVYHHQWFKTSTNTSIQKVKIPQGVEGNAYVNVVFSRDFKSKEIFASPLSYAIMPFNINRDKRIGKIELNYPTELKPGQQLKIKHSTKVNQRIIIFGVDQGILQVAGYRTPDPLSHFFTKKMHQVDTYQLVDLIMPEYSIVKEVFGIGGDVGDLLSQNLNPFKRKSNQAVTFWSGIINSGPKEDTFTYDIPDYFNGTIKVFAISVDEEKIGVFEDKVTVKGDFVIDPQLPLFATPGDKFEVSVLVTNNLKKNPSEKVTIEIKENDQFKVIGDKSKIVEIMSERDFALNFQIETLPKLGSGEIEIIAKTGSSLSKIVAGIGVRSQAPHEVKVTSQEITNKELTLNLDRQLHEELGAKSLRASFSPLVLAMGLSDYLDVYPHGCTEQLVSIGMPGIFVSNFVDKKLNESKWNKLIQNLQGRQNSNGLMSMFANYGSSMFNTIYTAHFLIEAKNQKRKIDLDLLNSIKDVLMNIFINKIPDDLDTARLMSYALYVLSLDGYLNSNALVTLRQNLDTNFKSWSEDLTAAFMAGTYQRYKMSNEASNVFKRINMDSIKINDDDLFTKETVRAFYLIVLANDFSMDKKIIKFNDVLDLVESVSTKNNSSLTTALTIMALAKWDNELAKNVDAEIIVNYKDRKESMAVNLAGSKIKTSNLGFNASKVTIKSKSDFPVFYQTVEKGFESTTLPSYSNEVEVFSKIIDEAGSQVSHAILGETYTMEVSARAINTNQYNLALVQMLPAGFEYMLKRGLTENEMQGTGSTEVYEENNSASEEENPSDSSSDTNPSNSLMADRLEGQDSNFNIQYIDLRDDRIVLYISNLDKKTSYFKFNLKAVYKGEFAYPGAYIEGMYKTWVKSRSEAQRITVKEK